MSEDSGQLVDNVYFDYDLGLWVYNQGAVVDGVEVGGKAASRRIPGGQQQFFGGVILKGERLRLKSFARIPDRQDPDLVVDATAVGRREDQGLTPGVTKLIRQQRRESIANRREIVSGTKKGLIEIELLKRGVITLNSRGLVDESLDLEALYPDEWRDAASATEEMLARLTRSRDGAAKGFATLLADNPKWQSVIRRLQPLVDRLPGAKSAINDLSEEAGVLGARHFLERHRVEVIFADAKAGANHVDVWGVREVAGELILVTLEAKGGDHFTLGDGKQVRDRENREIWYVRQSSRPYVLDEIARDENLPRFLEEKAAEYDRSDPARAQKFRDLVSKIGNLKMAILDSLDPPHDPSDVITNASENRLGFPEVEHAIYQVDSNGKGALYQVDSQRIVRLLPKGWPEGGALPKGWDPRGPISMDSPLMKHPVRVFDPYAVGYDSHPGLIRPWQPDLKLRFKVRPEDGVYGGRQGRLSILDELRRPEAESRYAEWRSDHRDMDVRRIWNNLNHAGVIQFSYAQLELIKNHLMRAEYEFAHRGGLLGSFDADPLIAEMWLRLIDDRGIPLDLVALEHELAEITYMLDHPGATIAEAHEFADRHWPWAAHAAGESDGLLSHDAPRPWENQSGWKRPWEARESWRAGLAGVPHDSGGRSAVIEPHRAGSAPQSGLGDNSPAGTSESDAIQPGLGADAKASGTGLGPGEEGKASAPPHGDGGESKKDQGPWGSGIGPSDAGTGTPASPRDTIQTPDEPDGYGIVPSNQLPAAAATSPSLGTPSEEGKGTTADGEQGGSRGRDTKPGLGVEENPPRARENPNEGRVGSTPGVAAGPKANEAPKSGLGVEPTVPGIGIQQGAADGTDARGAAPKNLPDTQGKTPSATEGGVLGENPGASSGGGTRAGANAGGGTGANEPAPRSQTGSIPQLQPEAIVPADAEGHTPARSTVDSRSAQPSATASADSEGRSPATNGSSGSRSAQPVPAAEAGAPQDRTSGKYGIPTAEDVYRAAARARSANAMASMADIVGTLIMMYDAAEKAGVEQPGTGEAGKPTYFDDPTKYEGLLPPNQLWPEGASDKWMLENKPEDWLRINYPQFYDRPGSVDPAGTLPVQPGNRAAAALPALEYVQRAEYQPGIGVVGPDGALIAPDRNPRTYRPMNETELENARWDTVQEWRAQNGLSSDPIPHVVDVAKYLEHATFRKGVGLVGPDGALIDPNYQRDPDSPSLRYDIDGSLIINGVRVGWAEGDVLRQWDLQHYNINDRTAKEIEIGYQRRDPYSYIRDARFVPGVGLVGPNGAVIDRNWKAGNTLPNGESAPIVPSTDENVLVHSDIPVPASAQSVYEFYQKYGFFPGGASPEEPFKGWQQHSQSRVRPSERRNSAQSQPETGPSTAGEPKPQPDDSNGLGTRTAQPGVSTGQRTVQPGTTNGSGKESTVQPGVSVGAGNGGATQPEGMKPSDGTTQPGPTNGSGVGGTVQPGVTNGAGQGNGQSGPAGGSGKGNVQPGISQPAQTDDGIVQQHRTGNQKKPVERRVLGGSVWAPTIGGEPVVPWAVETFAPLDVSAQMSMLRSTMDMVSSTRLPVQVNLPSPPPDRTPASGDRRLAVQIAVRDDSGIGQRKRESAKAMALGARL